MKIYASTERRASRSCDPQRLSAALDSAPADFDATANPILAEHFFGIRSFRQINDVAAVVVAGLKRERAVAP